ncbi:MAG: hypothetical protein V4726_07310 [Verrucomicrobiota bacterium]
MTSNIAVTIAAPVQLLASDGGTRRVVIIDVEGGDARFQFDGASVSLTASAGSPVPRGGKLCLEGAAAMNAIHGIGCSSVDSVKITVQTWNLPA